MHRYSQSKPDFVALLWRIDFLVLLLKGQANHIGSGWPFQYSPNIGSPVPVWIVILNSTVCMTSATPLRSIQSGLRCCKNKICGTSVKLKHGLVPAHTDDDSNGFGGTWERAPESAPQVSGSWMFLHEQATSQRTRLSSGISPLTPAFSETKQPARSPGLMQVMWALAAGSAPTLQGIKAEPLPLCKVGIVSVRYLPHT